MHLQLEIAEDYVRFGKGPSIARPVNLSRARWVAFWRHILVRGITVETLQDAEDMMRSRKTSER